MKIFFLILSFFSIHFISAQKLFEQEPMVRVRIINTVDTLRIIFNSDWILASDNLIKQFKKSDRDIFLSIENGRIKIFDAEGETFSLLDKFILQSSGENGSLKIKNVPFGVGWWWENSEDREYEGSLHFYINKENKFEVVNHLPLENYLMGVVPYEIGGNSPLEAVKAQAVAARSEAIMALSSNLYSGEHHDLTPDVECQVFGGIGKRTENSDRAVIETKSLVISENGKPINAYYASNCGGHSELIKNVWGERPVPDSYSIAHSDYEDSVTIDLSDEENVREWIFSNPPSYCNPYENDLPDWSKNNFRWKREFTFEEIYKQLASKFDSGNLIEIKANKRGTSGRIYNVQFVFEDESVEVSGELKIRQMLAPPLKSSCFVVDKTETGFIFYGAGWGHGVGMCQSGAIAMAKQGKNFEEILKHYYRKTGLLKIY
jgi:SpoIID/LytB domain protein